MKSAYFLPTTTLIGLLLLGPLSVRANPDWGLELQPPHAGYYSPSGEFQFEIPSSVPAQALARLALELDQIDVTAFVSSDGRNAVFTPPHPLEPGMHQLRVVEYAEDGSILERGIWEIEVRQSAAFREAGFNSNLGVTGRKPVGKRNLPDLETNWRLQGGVSLGGTLADADAQAAGTLELMNQEESEGGKLDLAGFHAQVLHAQGQADLGHHSLPLNNLLVQSFGRRGVSGAWRSADGRQALFGFAMRTEPITGFHHGLGVSDPGHRISGAWWQVTPLADPQRLALRVVYLSGEGDEGGDATIGGLHEASGDGAALVADSMLWNSRLRVRGEYATSRFDFDGTGGTLEGLRDRAFGLLTMLTSAPERTNGMTWNAGVELKEVGTYFHSLANPNLPSDRRLIRAFGTARWPSFSMSAIVGRETTNVDDLENIPRYCTDQLSWNGVYVPTLVRETPWYGQPQFSAWVGTTNIAQETNPAGPGFPEVDQLTRSYQLRAGFGYDWGGWSVDHTLSRFDDHSGLQADTETNSTTLATQIRIGERLSLGVSLARSAIEDRDTAMETENFTGTLDASAQLLPNRLNTYIRLSVNEDRATRGLQNARTATLSADLDWTMMQEQAGKPGLTASLSAVYNDLDDKLAMAASPSTYQIFLGLRLGWSVNR